MNKASPNQGVIYVATSPHFTDAARQSALSVRATNPWLKVGIFTDQEISDPVFDFVGKIPQAGGRQKHLFLAQSPFEETLYLDSDTRVTGSLKDLFAVLERFEMAGASVRYRTSPRRQGAWRVPIPISFPQVNCGVLLYRNSDRVKAFFADWTKAINDGGFNRDQVPFREILWLSDLRFHTLGPEYNTRSIELWPFPTKRPLPLILHVKAFHAHEAWKRLAARILLLPMRRRLRIGGLRHELD